MLDDAQKKGERPSGLRGGKKEKGDGNLKKGKKLTLEKMRHQHYKSSRVVNHHT